MKSHITVILDENSPDLSTTLELALASHYFSWNDVPEDIPYKEVKRPKHHWDYWCFPYSGKALDPNIQNKYPQEGKDILANASFIKNLPANYSTSGIIDLNGKWIDLQDFGWAMLNEPSKINTAAATLWKLEYKELLQKNKEHICIQVTTHC